MSNLSLTLQAREIIGKQVSKLRKQGKIPAILYGHGLKSTPVLVDAITFAKVYRQAGESTLMELTIDAGKPVTALIHEVQQDPITNQIVHIDFHQVKMDEKLKANIALKFVGEAPAVKEFSSILVTPLNNLEAECLPKDLVHEIEVDLSSLNQVNAMIHVADIKVPAGITILNQPDTVVAMVQEPKAEKEPEVVAPAAEAVTATPTTGEASTGAKTTEPVEKDKKKA